MPELINTPSKVEAAGTKPKTIEEYVGRVNSGEERVSVARMRSPRAGSSRASGPSSTSTRWCWRVACGSSTRTGRSTCARAGRARARRRVGALLDARAGRRVLRRGLPAGVLARERPPRRLNRSAPSARCRYSSMHGAARHSIWVKLLLLAVFVGGPAWWLERHDRLDNEARLGEIASAIAGRRGRRCPGLSAVLTWDTVEGSVQYDGGPPSDEARCARATSSTRSPRGAAPRWPAPSGESRAAMTSRAVDVLAHESWHFAGVADEAAAECARSPGRRSGSARRLSRAARSPRATSRPGTSSSPIATDPHL